MITDAATPAPPAPPAQPQPQTPRSEDHQPTTQRPWGAHPQIVAARDARPGLIAGAPHTVLVQLEELVERSGASEIMLDTETYALAERLRSLELVAQPWGLSGSRVWPAPTAFEIS